MQIDMLVNSFANDCRVATLQYTKSVGQAKMNWLDIDDYHPFHEPDKNLDAYEKLVRIFLVCRGWLASSKMESLPNPGRKDQCSTYLGHLDKRIG